MAHHFVQSLRYIMLIQADGLRRSQLLSSCSTTAAIANSPLWMSLAAPPPPDSLSVSVSQLALWHQTELSKVQ